MNSNQVILQAIGKNTIYLLPFPALMFFIFHLSRTFSAYFLGLPAIMQYNLVAFDHDVLSKMDDSMVSSGLILMTTMGIVCLYTVAFLGVKLFYLSYKYPNPYLKWVGIMMAAISLKPCLSLIERVWLVLYFPKVNWNTGEEFWLADMLGLQPYLFVISLSLITAFIAYLIIKKVDTLQEKIALSISLFFACPIGIFLWSLLGKMLLS
jgi:hypothetical protein